MFRKQEGQEFVELKSKQGHTRKFIKVKFLGSGGFARCYEVKQEANQNRYAFKIIKKSLLSSPQLVERLKIEIRLHKKFVGSTHIVTFLESFENKEYIYLLLELCPNQTLNQLIRRRKSLSEEEMRYYIRQLALGLKQIHQKNIVHRDIKLCNLFIDASMQLKIGDFGLATQVLFDEETNQLKKRHTICGTANYIAPEILRKDEASRPVGHSFEVDIWSLGVVAFTTLFGRYPFEDEDEDVIYSKIMQGKFSFPSKSVNATEEVKKFIWEIFEQKPQNRISLTELLNHQFLSKTNIPSSLPTIALRCAITNDKLSELFSRKVSSNQKSLKGERAQTENQSLESKSDLEQQEQYAQQYAQQAYPNLKTDKSEEYDQDEKNQYQDFDESQFERKAMRNKNCWNGNNFVDLQLSKKQICFLKDSQIYTATLIINKTKIRLQYQEIDHGLSNAHTQSLQQNSLNKKVRNQKSKSASVLIKVFVGRPNPENDSGIRQKSAQPELQVFSILCNLGWTQAIKVCKGVESKLSVSVLKSCIRDNTSEFYLQGMISLYVLTKMRNQMESKKQNQSNSSYATQTYKTKTEAQEKLDRISQGCLRG